MIECAKCHAGPGALYQTEHDGYLFQHCFMCGSIRRLAEPEPWQHRPEEERKRAPTLLACAGCGVVVEAGNWKQRRCPPCAAEFKRQRERARSKFRSGRGRGHKPSASARLAHEMAGAGAFSGSRAQRG